MIIFADRDGRIKVIGGDGIEGLLISPKQLPYKYIEVSIYTIYYNIFPIIYVWFFFSCSLSPSLVLAMQDLE